ncbi:MAG TPA: TIGR04255 family protein [Caldisericia bacterium]|mgnify:CR=1 FL=1|nr:TIGR04255 family protein [Caldisericia bacterium]HPB34260.1 TIGR04255 family protein [Caldisericia bacterium]HQL65939.1 TIGR04255 family protein [Caldisericia bacterium]HQO99642.1 TIGR04255 family protein [Caldisericia bacterium]
MEREYKNPPLVEALCEFQFIPLQPYDLTIPGLFYEKIKEEFPEKQEQAGIGFQLQTTEKGIEQKIIPTLPKVQFFKSDKTSLVQIAPELLVINCLKPYQTWEKFKSLILKNLEVYKEIVKPKGFRRIGLRYINVFEFDKLDIKLEDYFYYHPIIPKDLPQKFDSFLNRIEIPYEDDKLILTLATIVPKKTKLLSITLDIEYVMIKPEKITFDDISFWLDKAHEIVENAFESSITDKARELFEEVK